MEKIGKTEKKLDSKINDLLNKVRKAKEKLPVKELYGYSFAL